MGDRTHKKSETQCNTIWSSSMGLVDIVYHIYNAGSTHNDFYQSLNPIIDDSNNYFSLMVIELKPKSETQYNAMWASTMAGYSSWSMHIGTSICSTVVSSHLRSKINIFVEISPGQNNTCWQPYGPYK